MKKINDLELESIDRRLVDLGVVSTPELSSRRADTVEVAEVVKPTAWMYRTKDQAQDRLWYWSAWRSTLTEPVFHERTIFECVPLVPASTTEALSSQVDGLKLERDERLAVDLAAAKRYAVLFEYADALFRRAEKAEAALASQAIPEGFVLAPKEPTETMIDAGVEAFYVWGIGRSECAGIYRAALAAIPAAPEVNK